MRLVRTFTAVIILILAFYSFISADTIKLKNGKIVKGRIIEIRDNTYTIKTLSGTYNIDESQIADVSWETTGEQQEQEFKEEQQVVKERLVRKNGWFVMPEIKYMLFGEDSTQAIFGKGMPLYGFQFGMNDKQYMLGFTFLGGNVTGSTNYYNNTSYVTVPVEHGIYTMIVDGAFRWNIGKKPIILPFIGGGLGFGMAFDTLKSQAITGPMSHQYGLFTMDANCGLEFALGSDIALRLETGFISLPLQNFDYYQLINTGTGYFSAGLTFGADIMFKF
jgi:hypothetical protein